MHLGAQAQWDKGGEANDDGLPELSLCVALSSISYARENPLACLKPNGLAS